MSDPDFVQAHSEILALHQEKSSTYGAPGDSFRNFTVVAEALGRTVGEYYACLRIIEKATRALNMMEEGKSLDVKEWPDIAGLALCCEAMRRKRV